MGATQRAGRSRSVQGDGLVPVGPKLTLFDSSTAYRASRVSGEAVQSAASMHGSLTARGSVADTQSDGPASVGRTLGGVVLAHLPGSSRRMCPSALPPA